MRPSNDLPVVYLCREAVDFRKGINGLAALVVLSVGLFHRRFLKEYYRGCGVDSHIETSGEMVLEDGAIRSESTTGRRRSFAERGGLWT
jgi:hypothetical protein